MLKNKILVFISEPSWLEKPIPNWLVNKNYFVITESDSVINECYLKGLDVSALSEYIDPSKNIEFINKSIEIEQNEIKNLSIQYKDNIHFAEFYHGISTKIYSLNYYHETIENLFKIKSFDQIIFISGEKFNASNEETPKGSYLQYNYFKYACKKYKKTFIKTSHQVYLYKEINSINKRYDFYFTQSNKLNFEDKIISNDIIESTKPKTLFIYQYEACRNDLEPLLDQELLISNVLKMKTSTHAPSNLEYDFDLTNLNYSKKITNSEYSFNLLMNIFESHFYFLEKKLLHLELNKYFKYYKKINESVLTYLIEIEKIINDNNISKIIITAFPSPFTSVIAKYFTLKNVKVILRQHGEISSIQWPSKCFVKGVEFSTISNYFKSSIQNFTNNITVTYRYSDQPNKTINAHEKRNVIVITNDLFFNPRNKVLFINFFQTFYLRVINNYFIKLRSHPRYFGDLLPGVKNNKITYENSRDVNLVESFKNCNLFIMPSDTFSSVLLDAIRYEIPSVIIAPIGLKSTSEFEPFCYGYPLIINNAESLCEFITNIENNNDFRDEVLVKQRKWLNEIVDHNINNIPSKQIANYTNSKLNINVTIYFYFKRYLKNRIKNILFYLNFKN